MRTQTIRRHRKTSARERSTAGPSLRIILAADESDAPALQQRLAAAFGEGRHLAIDAGAVAVLTTAGVQVLLAAAADAAARKLDFRLAAGGPAVVAAFGELGLADSLAAWRESAEREGAPGT